MSRRLFYSIFIILIALLFLATLWMGSVSVSLGDLLSTLVGTQTDTALRFIIIESRLPASLTAILAGVALGLGGLLMQTVLENPLAEPGILGVGSGASLGAAIALLLPGVAIGAAFNATGWWLVVLCALIGSLIVIALLAICSTLLRSNVLVLIAGVMVSYLVGSGTSILSMYATDYGVQSFVLWGMGDFGSLTLSRMSFLAGAIAFSVIPLALMTRQMDALLLGSDYAQLLGVPVRTVRSALLLLCGFLTAVVTACCGPIAFIGLAAPHAARFLLRRSDHATLIPATLFTGASLSLLTLFLCQCLSPNGTLPINAVTPIIGAPVMLLLILKHRHV